MAIENSLGSLAWAVWILWDMLQAAHDDFELSLGEGLIWCGAVSSLYFFDQMTGEGDHSFLNTWTLEYPILRNVYSGHFLTSNGALFEFLMHPKYHSFVNGSNIFSNFVGCFSVLLTVFLCYVETFPLIQAQVPDIFLCFFVLWESNQRNYLVKHH